MQRERARQMTGLFWQKRKGLRDACVNHFVIDCFMIELMREGGRYKDKDNTSTRLEKKVDRSASV